MNGWRTTMRMINDESLMQTMHVAWVNTLRRSREGVMRRYLTWRCDNADVAGARVENRTSTGRKLLPAALRNES